MATTFTTVTDWRLAVLDPSQEYGGKNPPGSRGVAADGYEWVRDLYVVRLYREGYGLSSIDPRIGEVIDGANISWVNGPNTITVATGYNYKCLENGFEALEPGFSRESIVWKWESMWWPVETSTAPFNAWV